MNEDGRMTRDERRAKAVLNEARKAGTVEPAVDRLGNLINPHIPEFMAKAPWYLNQREDDGLKHQKASGNGLSKGKAADPGLDTWYKRGTKASEQSSQINSSGKRRKFAKGSCRNCGAKTHTEKDCMERPRKIGAWKSGSVTAADDCSQDRIKELGKLSYAASRDRWNGYDVEHHLGTVRLYNRAEEEKRKQVIRERDMKLRRKRALNDGQDVTKNESETDGNLCQDSDEESEDSEDVLGVRKSNFEVGTAVKTTVPNLRVREDIAKYLRNLDDKSAYFDPKTRSMRANPNPDLDPTVSDFSGDNYVRVSGDAIEMARSQIFAWESGRRNNAEAHLEANPTKSALLRKQHEERALKLKQEHLQSLHDRYGGESHFLGKSDEAMGHKNVNIEFEEDESAYVEYSADGRILKANHSSVQSKPTTKYPENVLEGNHTKVWGSYFDRESMKWGFGCCSQTVRKSYCTGEAGRAAELEAAKFRQTSIVKDSEA